MRYVIIILLVVLGSFSVKAQSPTTEKLHKKYGDALSLFFYNNTLRMLNQANNKEFDELIRDIEKMKFLMISKAGITKSDYKNIVSLYKADSFEEMMTSRSQGKNFDVFVKEKNGETKGMLVLVNDSTNLYVLDIVGKLDMTKVSSLYSVMSESSDVGQRIKDFTRKKEGD